MIRWSDGKTGTTDRLKILRLEADREFKLDLAIQKLRAENDGIRSQLELAVKTKAMTAGA